MPMLDLGDKLLAECKECALQRDSNRRNSVDYSSDRTNDKSRWSYIGVVGEVALLKFFDLPINWHFLSTDAGFCQVDVGDIWEVRAVSKFSNRLFLWEDEVKKYDKLRCAWSKVVVDIDVMPGTCWIEGWAMGYEIALHGMHAHYDCKRASYFLNNKDLRRHGDPASDQSEALKLHHLYNSCLHETHI